MIDWNKLRSTPANANRRYKPVSTPSQGPGKREPAAGVLFKAGRFIMNMDASDIWHFIVRETPNLPTNYVVWFGVMEESNLIGAYPVAPGTAGASAIRFTQRDGSPEERDVTLYLDGVFRDYPNLRPRGKRKVTVAFQRDSDGKAHLEINLASQLAMRTTSRKGAAGDAGEEDEDGLEDEA